MRFRVLGPVEVETGDGRVVRPVRRRERCLLALLLLEAGRVVPGYRLIDLLWDGDPPERARQLLYGHIARVRTLLAAAGGAAYGVELVSHGDGYQLRVDPDAVDLHRFRALVDRATGTPQLADRDRLLAEALDLWRGPALHNAASDRLRERMCSQLDELRLHAVEEAIATGLALGRHGELVGELARLSAAHPLRSRLVGLRMVALHQTGRTADALAAYAAAGAALAEDFGLDPDPGLRRLHDAILRDESVSVFDAGPPFGVGAASGAGHPSGTGQAA